MGSRAVNEAEPLTKIIISRPEDVVEERACPGSVARAPSPEGSTSSNVFLWGQSMLVIADLLTRFAH